MGGRGLRTAAGSTFGPSQAVARKVASWCRNRRQLVSESRARCHPVGALGTETDQPLTLTGSGSLVRNTEPNASRVSVSLVREFEDRWVPSSERVVAKSADPEVNCVRRCGDASAFAFQRPALQEVTNISQLRGLFPRRSRAAPRGGPPQPVAPSGRKSRSLCADRPVGLTHGWVRLGEAYRLQANLFATIGL